MYVLLAGALVLSLVTINAKAGGDNGRFSVGAEAALPMGTFGDGYSLGVGGSLRYEMPMGDNLGLTATAGYISFSGKSVAGYTAPSYSMIPIQVGAKYYFQEQQNGFYGMVELGVHSLSYKVNLPSINYTTGAVTYTETTFTATDLSFAPEVGYMLANVDIGLRYQIISSTGGSTSYLGVRLAYVFGEK